MIKPIKKRVLIKEIPSPEFSDSGLYLGKQKEKIRKGEIISVADDVVDVKVGDIVLFDYILCTEIKHQGEDYLMVIDKELVAVYDKQLGS